MLAASTVMLVLAVYSPAVTSEANECPREVRETVGCSAVTATLGNGTADLTGSTEGTGGDSTSSSSGDGGTTAPTDTPCRYVLDGRCVSMPHAPAGPAAVTLADVASFRPTAAVDHMEPSGWTIAGLDTNFFATGGQHVRDGVLLAQPASVRFTPVAWHWSYGDGGEASAGTSGAPWAAQGIHEFDATPTSHVYENYGSYVIDLSVDYAAEYRFADGGWTAIDGYLTLPANQLTITVGNARTVLVERECTKNPRGPGC